MEYLNRMTVYEATGIELLLSSASMSLDLLFRMIPGLIRNNKSWEGPAHSSFNSDLKITAWTTHILRIKQNFKV